MRWNTIGHDFRSGDFRYKKRFLWLPLKINNEVRWFELATIQEMAYIKEIDDHSTLSWKPISFEDDYTGEL